MTTTLLFAIIFITLALLFYSIGVWSERLAKRLKAWHLVFFWLGLAADTTGTTLMTMLSDRPLPATHMVTGVIAILLMLIHAAWATVVLARQDERAIANFHRFSVFVWIVWLIPFFNGTFMSR